MILKKYTSILLLILSIFLFELESKAQSNDCLKKLEYAFTNRGSYVVEDAIHKNVIIATYKSSGNICYNGKVRVENGTIVTIFIELEDSTYEVYDKKFTNEKKTAPTIENGISELILSENGDKFKIIFIEKIKPKSKSYKEADLPDDL